MIDPNQQLYAQRRIVQYYTQLQQLQPAEQTILNLFRDRWARMKMLDIGVGGGRTTAHFAPLAQEYVGIDYAAAMIAACQQRFATASLPLSFAVCDARDMSQFADATFDFILFSFNGLDYVNHRDRLQSLQEIRRVGKPGGYFCFSSHNLQSLEPAFQWHTQLRWNPISTYVNLVMWGLLRLVNQPLTVPKIQAATHAIIKDESHNFRLQTYYIRPQTQIAQLAAHFDHIRIYSWSTGLELTSESDLHHNTESWLYYVCRFKSGGSH